jgi:hypothetical protein
MPHKSTLEAEVTIVALMAILLDSCKIYVKISAFLIQREIFSYPIAIFRLGLVYLSGFDWIRIISAH